MAHKIHNVNAQILLSGFSMGGIFPSSETVKLKICRAKLFYFIIQCPQSLPESAGKEIKIKIRKNKNILLKIYILYKFNFN